MSLDVMEPYAGAGATMLMSIAALAVRERELSRFAERDLRRLIACRIADMLSADALDGGPSWSCLLRRCSGRRLRGRPPRSGVQLGQALHARDRGHLRSSLALQAGPVQQHPGLS